MVANSLITSLSTALLVGASIASVVRAAETTPAVATAEIEQAAADSSSKVAGGNSVVSLGKIEAEVENDLTIVTARLSTQPSWKTLDIEDHGTFIQVKMPGTVIANSGEFFDGNGPYLKKLASFQVTDTDGALRLFLNQDAAKAKLATTAELLGERIVITIDHKKLEQLIRPSSSAAQAAAAAAAAVTPASNDSSAKATGESSPSNQKLGTGPEGLNLKDKLMSAAAFCAAMLLFLLGSSLWRNKRIKSRKAARAFEGVDPAPMKILSHLSISSRQRLSLVQVGSQQILIGVSPDNISFLTEVTPKSRPSSPQQQSFSAQLLHANPNAEVKLKQTDLSTPKPVRKPADAATTSRPVVRAKPVQTTQGRINVGVGDDGVSDLRTRGIKNDRGSADQPFDDITKMIRDRLKNLPPAP